MSQRAADRGTPLMTCVVAAGEPFGHSPRELRNDSTSVRLCGQYAPAKGRSIRGKRAPWITLGRSRDHRRDLELSRARGTARVASLFAVFTIFPSADALALATGELVGIAARVLGRESDALQGLPWISSRPWRSQILWIARPSATIAPTVMPRTSQRAVCTPGDRSAQPEDLGPGLTPRPLMERLG